MHAIPQVGGYDAHDVRRFLEIVRSTNKIGDDRARGGRGGEHGMVHMLPIGGVDGVDEVNQTFRFFRERSSLGFPEAPLDVLQPEICYYFFWITHDELDIWEVCSE